MNSDILQGKWRQLRGKIKQSWGDLTDDELAEIDGRREKLSGKLQERYGWNRERAENEIDTFLDNLGDEYRM